MDGAVSYLLKLTLGDSLTSFKVFSKQQRGRYYSQPCTHLFSPLSSGNCIPDMVKSRHPTDKKAAVEKITKKRNSCMSKLVFALPILQQLKFN